MARVSITITLEEQNRDDLGIIAPLLGYSLSSYAERAIAEALQADKARFPKAYEINKTIQEEERAKRSA